MLAVQVDEVQPQHRKAENEEEEVHYADANCSEVFFRVRERPDFALRGKEGEREGSGE
mgnify:CR=1 FL=1